MVKFVEIVSIFKQPFLRMSSVLMFIAIALFVDAVRQLCGVKSQNLASLNSFLTHLQMGSGEAGLYGFPHVITAALWSVRLLLLLKYCLRQATTQRSGLSYAQNSSMSDLHRFLECFSGWVETKETEMLLIIILSMWNVSKVCTLWPSKSSRRNASFCVKFYSIRFQNIEKRCSHPTQS